MNQNKMTLNDDFKILLNYTMFLRFLSVLSQFICLTDHIAIVPSFLWFILSIKNIRCYHSFLLFLMLVLSRKNDFIDAKWEDVG